MFQSAPCCRQISNVFFSEPQFVSIEGSLSLGLKREIMGNRHFDFWSGADSIVYYLMPVHFYANEKVQDCHGYRAQLGYLSLNTLCIHCTCNVWTLASHTLIHSQNKT